MFNKVSAICLLVIVLFASACDVIEGPKVDPSGFTGTSNKVLIEDFTGHMCGNCPNAHRQAAILKATYGENLVVVAVHTTGFANVVPSLGFVTDYKTEAGNELENYFEIGNAGLPTGMVNRQKRNGRVLTRFPDWGTQVGAVLQESSKMKIDLETSFDPSLRQVQISAHLEYFIEGDATHRIIVLITEDSLVSKQYDFAAAVQEVDDYVQDHVLRASVTPGTWGIPVKGNTIFLGEKIDRSFSYTLDASWRPEKCSVVAYVMNDITKEVLQVQEAKLIE